VPSTTFDGLLARKLAGYERNVSFMRAYQSAGAAVWAASSTDTFNGMRFGTYTVPTLEAGVDAYVPTMMEWNASIGPGITFMVAEQISLGTLSLATPTFTDGSSAPTRTVGNTSTVVPGFCIGEVTTALNATPGNATVTYVDQDNNTAETTRSLTLGASAPVGSFSSLPLNSPDWGVRDITTATRTGGTSPSGVIQFWWLNPIYVGPNATISLLSADLLGLGTVRRFGTGAQLGLFGFSTSTQGVYGHIDFVGDSA